MQKKKKILGIITARGGSKRIPGKNIKVFAGRPLLAWSIKAGKKSKVFDKFILSTDDKEIAKIGKKYGIEVPFLRPAEFSQDKSSSFGAIKHAVEWLKEHENYETDWIILLEPTAPGRQAFHIKEVKDIIKEQGDKIDSIVGITEMPGHFNPCKALKIIGNNIVVNMESKPLRRLIHRNQDVPAAYYINSAIYAFKTANLFAQDPSLWGEKTYGYVMDERYSFDIDTPDDWTIAEIKMKNLLSLKC